MREEKDRCSRIAELLLIENEVDKIEKASTCLAITDSVLYSFYRQENEQYPFTPIEKIMYAILMRVADEIYFCYNHNFEIGIQYQKQIDKYRVDFLVTANYSNDKIIIECDGHDFHEKTKEQAKHDKEKDRYLTSLGYKILHYTGSEIYNDFCHIEHELFKMLDIPCTPYSLFGEKK